MKIIQIIPNFGMGGAETMCENLSCELSRMGHDVIVVSLYDFHSAITDRLEERGVDVRYLGKKRGLDLSVVKKLRTLFRKERPDAIHSHLYAQKYAVLAAILAGIKRRVHTVHNVAEKESEGKDQKLNRVFYRVNHVIPVSLSPEIQRTVSAVYGLKPERIPVVYNGIDLSKCRQKQNYNCGETFHILHIGRFSEQKNHIGLVKAFELFHAEHQNSVLSLIGDGEKRPEIEEYVKEQGLSDFVRFLGLRSDVYGYLHEADVFTLPSHFEGVPMTLIEAMGTGLPIVATAVGGVSDMLENNKSAWLVPCETQAIADAFSEAYRDTDKRKKLGKAALARSADFSVQKMAQAYTALYGAERV